MRSVLVAILCFLFVGCSMLTPTQRDRLREAVQQEYAEGNITAAQRDAAIEAIEKDEPVDWEALGIVGINMLMALVGGPLIVRKMRGPPEKVRRKIAGSNTPGC